MPDDLGGGLVLVTQDDDIELDDGSIGQAINEGVPDVVLQVTQEVSLLVEEETQLQVVTTEEVINLVEDTATPDFITEIVWGGPKGDTGPQGPQGIQGEQGPRVTFVQPDAPVTDESTYLWIQTGVGDGGDLTFWVEDGTA